MLARLAERFRNPADFVAPADCWGDVGAATVPLLIALVAGAAERATPRARSASCIAGSESGRRSLHPPAHAGAPEPCPSPSM